MLNGFLIQIPKGSSMRYSKESLQTDAKKYLKTVDI